MGWANRITVLRGVFTVAVWVVLLLEAPAPGTTTYWVAFAMFTFTALTDVVDGAIARRYGDVSVFGRIADPLVDKLLVLGTLVVLVSLADMTVVVPAWAVLVVLGRELLVTALRGAIEGKGISFQAMPLGKVKMGLQSIATGTALLYGAGFALARAPVPLLETWFGPAWTVAHLLVWAAALVTAVSGIDYGVRAARILRR